MVTPRDIREGETDTHSGRKVVLELKDRIPVSPSVFRVKESRQQCELRWYHVQNVLRDVFSI